MRIEKLELSLVIAGFVGSPLQNAMVFVASRVSSTTANFGTRPAGLGCVSVLLVFGVTKIRFRDTFCVSPVGSTTTYVPAETMVVETPLFVAVDAPVAPSTSA